MQRGHPDHPLHSTPSAAPAGVGPWPRRLLTGHVPLAFFLCAFLAAWSPWELFAFLLFVELGPVPEMLPLLWFLIAIPACGILFFRLLRWPTFRQTSGSHAVLASLWMWLAALRVFGSYVGP